MAESHTEKKPKRIVSLKGSGKVIGKPRRASENPTKVDTRKEKKVLESQSGASSNGE